MNLWQSVWVKNHRKQGMTKMVLKRLGVRKIKCMRRKKKSKKISASMGPFVTLVVV